MRFEIAVGAGFRCKTKPLESGRNGCIIAVVQEQSESGDKAFAQDNRFQIPLIECNRKDISLFRFPEIAFDFLCRLLFGRHIDVVGKLMVDLAQAVDHAGARFPVFPN